MAEDSIFTRIIKGELPSHKVYEDDRVLAFMDIHPVRPGMVVVVPKNQLSNFEDLPTKDYHALWDAVQKVARKLRQVFPDKKKICVQVEGLDVDHAHVKLYPINTGEEFRDVADDSLEPDHAALAELAQKLRISE